jgi:hypothetical protein
VSASGRDFSHRQNKLANSHGGRKETKRNSPKLTGAIVILSFDSSSLEFFKSNNCNIKIKKQSLKFKEGKGTYLLACCNV